ncbi:MAG: DUF2437 domain-containing protein [Pseudonocardiaceae bacterium]|nr:DUF2437 domain-containing protein [Pseudonocardiaceae bacterium]
MHIVRFADHDDKVHSGLLTGGGQITRFEGVEHIAELMTLRAAELTALVTETASHASTHSVGEVTLLPPVDRRMEVWAAGVTYRRSREARVEESTERSVYEKVYDAERPELFLKAQPWRVVTYGEPVAVRADSPLNVPEPELGVVVNRHAETIGYTVINDVSSRSIEGENPLYLPQAKIYAGSCAVSPVIRPAWEIADPPALDIAMTVRRGADTAFQASISTEALHRSPGELVRCLFEGQPFPDGAILATGTGIVPDMDFTLLAGDVVDIEISEVGQLATPVVAGLDAMEWLVTAAEKPSARPRRS